MAERREHHIEQALTWAFATECAQIDTPETGYRRNVGTEYRMLKRAELGGVQIDGGGHSLPHDDAEILAGMVSNLPEAFGGMGMAITVAQHARTKSRPDAMLGAVPRLWPANWGGGAKRMGKSVEIAGYQETFYRPHPKNRAKMIKRTRMVKVGYTPCIWEPHPDLIRDMRRGYHRWWLALDYLRQVALEYPHFVKLALTSEMPPYKPWESR